MEYRVLGRTGVRVSTLGLGTMMFGAFGNPDHDECERIVHEAIDAGINLVDTANVYSRGESEEILGKALKDRRDDVILATKFHGPMGSGPNDHGNSRRHIFQAVEASLRRLGTDWIDLYQVHRPDPDTDIEETLDALTDLVRQGKVRYLGTSTFPASLLVESLWCSEREHLERFVTEQPPYSIFARAVEADILPTLERHRTGCIVWSPLCGGWLTGKYRKERPAPEGSRATNPGWRRLRPDRFDFEEPGNAKKLELVEELLPLAQREGASLARMAVAWTLEHRTVTSALIGPKSVEQLNDLLPAADIRLKTDTIDRIDELVPPGTIVHPPDAGRVPPDLTDPQRRRR